jgi:Polyketide cyclase / dehydrase and lipid transport
MITLLRREFTVNVSQEEAWRHLARVDQWPSWAKHIKQVEVRPAGGLGPASTGVFRLSNGVKSAFTMAEFYPPRNWKWVGRFLWLTIYYDHLFEEADSQTTRLTWVLDGEGFGVSTLGKLFAKIYNRNLDKAIPALVEEMNRSKGETTAGTSSRVEQQSPNALA